MKNNFFSRVFVALVVVLLSFSMSSCSDSKLKVIVSSLDAQCPQSLGLAIELTHVSFEDNTVVYSYTLDEDYASIDNLAANPEAVKNNILTLFQNPNADMKQFVDMVIDGKADVRYVYKGKTSGKEFVTTLTSAELQEGLKNGAAMDGDKLSAAISSTNMQMPVDTGSGIVMNKVEDCGDVVFYFASVNELTTFNMISVNAASVKENIINSLKSLDGAADKLFFKLVVDAGKGLGYRYSTEGVDDTVDVVISNAELREIIGE